MITPYGFIPAARQVTFVPDQLIAGNLKLVTAQVSFAKAEQPYIRGAVVGRIDASGQYTMCVPTATDGSQIPVGVVVDAVDATQDVASGAIYEMGEFNIRYMSFDSGWDEAKLVHAMRLNQLFVKRSLSNDIV